ncbi:MAG: response regulator [Bryobacterales bacterium]|nr:response regulator [Bryobacterales bacterium]
MLTGWVRQMRTWLRASGSGTLEPESKYRELFENVPEAVYETSPDGRILAANPAMVRMLGFDSEAQLKQSMSAAGFYVDREQRLPAMRELEASGSLVNFEFDLVRRDGQRITVQDNARAVRNAKGQVVYHQGTLTEITIRKETERELRAARDAALEASRLKSQFLANMSHELRTPLNAVLGMARLLTDSPLDRSQRECADTILSSTHFLMDIIGELLDFSRIEAGRLELQDGIFRTREVVEGAVQLFAERTAASGIELICSIGAEVPELVCGDAPRLRQILVNLIGNGIKFTESGEVVVRVTGGTRIRFEVRDTGIGIPVEAHPFIFEPFRQADGSMNRRFGGTGLGLAIVREIVKAMSGVIGFQSEPGKGSTFWFEVPLAVAPGCRRADNRAPALLKGKRALLVEPNISAAAVYGAWLHHWGVKLVEATDAAPIDLVIATDAVLTGRASTDPTAGLGVTPGTPVFLLMPVDDAIGASAIPSWVTAVVKKPVRELALLDALLRAAVPRVEDPALALHSLARTLAPPRSATRILAAEDNKVNQTVIRKLVERLGHKIDVVGDGFQVIEAIGRSDYDLILMDCQMPGMDGLEATQAIRKLPPPLGIIPIIAVTAHAIQGDRELCYDNGMNDYLSKPILLEELAAAIERWSVRSGVAAVRERESEID